MALNKELIDKIIKVTSKAAISCHQFIGKNDNTLAWIFGFFAILYNPIIPIHLGAKG